LKSLSKISRFQATTCNLFDKIIKIPDAASFLFIYDEMFNKQIYKFATNETSPLIIDCGANIGLSTIYFKREYPNARIIAFEPDPKIFETLSYNIAAFDLKDVELMNLALWNTEEEVLFHSEGADAGRFYRDNDLHITKVKTTKLSKFLQVPVQLLK
jgi:FkbM family methyltransferase